MQPDTLCVLTQPDSLVQCRLVFLHRRTAYIDEIQRTLFVVVVSRRSERTETFIGNHAVRQGETTGFHMMPYQPLADVLRRALQILVVIIENATPIPVQQITDEISTVEPQRIDYYILRVHMIRARNRFSQLLCPIHRGVVHEKRLLQMHHVRPPYRFLNLFPMPIGIVIVKG